MVGPYVAVHESAAVTAVVFRVPGVDFQSHYSIYLFIFYLFTHNGLTFVHHTLVGGGVRRCVVVGSVCIPYNIYLIMPRHYSDCIIK